MADPEKEGVTPPKMIQFKGSCACGRVVYECSGLPSNRYTTACHCVTCRKLSGGPYQAFADVKSSSLTFFDNKESLRYESLSQDTIGGITIMRFSKVGDRSFCSTCYTPLAMRYKHEEEVVALALGAMDEESMTAETKEKFRLSAHIFVSQKAWWLDVEKDGLPLHDRFPNDFEANLEDLSDTKRSRDSSQERFAIAHR